MAVVVTLVLGLLGGFVLGVGTMIYISYREVEDSGVR